MPRIRTIKPEFWDSEKLARIPHGARLLFIGLWNFADDSGRLRGSLSWVLGRVFPYEPDLPIKAWVEALEDLGAIRRYMAKGEAFIEIPNFLKHQRIEKPSESRLPSFTEASPKPPGEVTPGTGKGKEQGTGKGKESSCPEPGKPASVPEVPLIDGTPYAVPVETFLAWKDAYPGVDVMAECRKAAAWEASNPKNRKVNKVRFLNGWLARAQDKGGHGVGTRKDPLAGVDWSKIGAQK